MDTRTLVERLTEYGVNIEEVSNRFVGNMDLYKLCLKKLFEDKSFTVIGEYLNSSDYKKAFEAAHAMKGAVGNMGLTPLYKLVFEFVEELRHERYETIHSYYSEVMDEYLKVKKLFEL